MRDVPVVKLTGRAARYVQLLQDFGHLDHEGVNRLLVGVAELHHEAERSNTGSPAVVDLPLVRRAAAMVLFPDEPPTDPPSLLDEDWPILFS